MRARRRAGAGLRTLPSAAWAARSGRLSPQHVTALSDCARRHSALAERDEAILPEQAEALDAEAFGVAVHQWAEHAVAVESPDPVLVPAAEPRDELYVSRTLGGRYELQGSFGPESGELIEAALGAEVDRSLRAARDGDPSVPQSAAGVRAAALVDLLSQTMRREPSEASVPDRYRVDLVVDANRCDDLPMACCDSPAYRIVLGAQGEVLDVGRLTQQWPAGLRRAITFRDKRCVFPGCDRPSSWCDIHHCQPWQHGGATSFENGVLLCRRHHTFIHEHDWRSG